MKVGFSYWGFCEDYNESEVVFTPDGGRFTRPIFARELFRRGYSIVALQQQRESNPLLFLQYDSQGFPELDCIFIEWRWSTYKNDVNHKDYVADGYEPDLDRQTAIMDHYNGKCPIVVWDTDLKVTETDKRRWDAVWAEPTLRPKNGSFSLLYFSDYKMRLPIVVPKNRYIYIGSNYERYDSVDKYYYNIGKTLNDFDVELEFYGNWLYKSVERPEQEEMVNKYSKYIKFHERNKFMEGMRLLNDSICTTHIVKNIYYENGLITPRFFESLSFGTPGLIPVEFPVALYGKRWSVDENNVVDKIMALSRLNTVERKNVIINQVQSMLEILPQTHINNFIDKVETMWKL